MQFDPDKNYSQIMGSSLYKWIQDGVYFDKNFEPIQGDAKEQEMPAVTLKTVKQEVIAVPKPE